MYVGIAGAATFTFAVAARIESATAWTVPSVVSGGGLVLAVVAVPGVVTANGGLTRVTWPLMALITSWIVALGVWSIVQRHAASIASATGSLGLVAVFGHVLDAVTTVVGVDILDFEDRVPLSAAVLDLAGTLPMAAIVGVGWVFFVTKLVLVIAIIALVAPTTRGIRGWECLLL